MLYKIVLHGAQPKNMLTFVKYNGAPAIDRKEEDSIQVVIDGLHIMPIVLSYYVRSSLGFKQFRQTFLTDYLMNEDLREIIPNYVHDQDIIIECMKQDEDRYNQFIKLNIDQIEEMDCRNNSIMCRS